MEVELAQQPLDGVILVRREVLITKPAAALDPKQISERSALHEIAVEDRLDLVLEPGALAHDLRAARDLPHSACVPSSATHTDGR